MTSIKTFDKAEKERQENTRGEIVVISPYKNFADLSEEIAARQGKEIKVYNAVLEQGVEIAKKYEGSLKTVIISRGATGALIKKKVKLPVIVVDITSFDIIQALHEARQQGEYLAYFEYDEGKNKYDFEKMQEILNLPRIDFYHYQKQEELDAKIKLASQNGIDVVVASGICILEKAREMGMDGVLVYSNWEAIYDALIRVEDVIRIRENDLIRNERMKKIIAHSYGGVLEVEKDGDITYVNNKARELLKLNEDEDIVGKNILSLKQDKEVLGKIFGNGDIALNEVETINNKKCLVNRIPIKFETQNDGMFINFIETSRIQKLENKIRRKLHTKGFIAWSSFSQVITNSPEMQKVIDKAKRYSKNDATVLITGESGTGKEIFAQGIHNESPRQEGPFVAINCATLPESLLESELFGYEEGAFTGAKKGGKPGLLELAHNGTIFLDEITEMTPSLQARLLRVLEEKVVRRIGGEKITPVDIRIIAACNDNIKERVKNKEFRSDLFYRLNVLHLNIPPLRKRLEDIPYLIKHFLKEYCEQENTEIKEIKPGQMNKLKKMNWYGNVRELKNFVEKYVLLSKDGDEFNSFKVLEELIEELLEEDLELCSNDVNYINDSNAANDSEDTQVNLEDSQKITVTLGTLKEMKEEIINKVSENYTNNKEELAKLLGISRTTLWKKTKQ